MSLEIRIGGAVTRDDLQRIRNTLFKYYPLETEVLDDALSTCEEKTPNEIVIECENEADHWCGAKEFGEALTTNSGDITLTVSFDDAQNTTLVWRYRDAKVYFFHVVGREPVVGMREITEHADRDDLVALVERVRAITSPRLPFRLVESSREQMSYVNEQSCHTDGPRD